MSRTINVLPSRGLGRFMTTTWQSRGGLRPSVMRNRSRKS
ncbi:hypothetical protein LINPERHAP1_LOCUS27738 [Linum perenne]